MSYEEGMLSDQEQLRKRMSERKVMHDFLLARRAKKKWIDCAQKDFEYFLGKQWDDADLAEAEKLRFKPLTINKIQSSIFMLSGLQRQNRSDFYAFPEGEEDETVSEMATKLLKNLMKVCNGENRISEMFEDGIICGEGWLEPYIDYTNDLVNGDMRFKKISPFCIFPDPNSCEYDLSDARYVIKFSSDLNIDQLEELFPGESQKIQNISEGKINYNTLDASGVQVHVEPNDGYRKPGNETNELGESTERTYDLIEYYYKKPVTKYFVVDSARGEINEFESEEEAQMSAMDGQMSGIKMEVVKRSVPEIWVIKLIGQNKMSDERAWTYPRWKNFHFIPYRSHWTYVDIKNKELLTQGIVRSLRDPQFELNKRRTQEMRHLNQSANSGWLSPEDAFINKEMVRRFGSAPGVMLEYNPDKGKPERIIPMPLSQGHAQMAAEHTQDMKEISGINADLLALNEDKNASGRAIRLRQQQGFVIIQRVLDNLAQTIRNTGKFLLAMLGEVYSLEEAKKVLGSKFIEDAFGVPVLVNDPDLGPREQIKVQDEILNQILKKIFSDTQLGKFDIAISEGQNSETTRLMNFAVLQELAQSGLPIPPEVLIESSPLAESAKEKIRRSIEQAQMAGAVPQLAQRQRPQGGANAAAEQAAGTA